MTILVSLFGLAGRVAGDLLTSALGWASSLLFGRVPRAHHVFLVLLMAGSFLWLLMVVGLLVPDIAALLLSSTPHPPAVTQSWLGLVLAVGVVALPLGVGLAGCLVPAADQRPGGAAVVREVLRGYVLAPLMGSLLIFLAGVGVVRKVRSWRHGWSDVHVAIVVKPGGYDWMVRDLQAALASVDLSVTARDAPRVLTLPAELLARAGGANLRNLRPDRLIELARPDLRIGVYHSDIAISGITRDRTRARAAILSRLATTSAHLTVSAEAQELEDRLEGMALHAGATSGMPMANARVAFKAIDARLLDLAVPPDEWDVLQRLRLAVERDLLLEAEHGVASRGAVEPPGTAILGASRSRDSGSPPAMAEPPSVPAGAGPVTVARRTRAGSGP